MMTTMQDREKAFEAKFALDEELRFKATARRNKLLGLWAAGLLAKSDRKPMRAKSSPRTSKRPGTRTSCARSRPISMRPALPYPKTTFASA